MIVNDLSFAMLSKDYIQGEIVLIGAVFNQKYANSDKNDVQTQFETDKSIYLNLIKTIQSSNLSLSNLKNDK